MDFSKGVATLKLSKTTKFDDGEFICKAENRVASESCSCIVTVKGDAQIFYLYIHWLPH